MHDEKITTHPSFGMLQITRVTGCGGRPLYGSSLRHHNLIALRILRSKVGRSLNRDWYYGHDELIEVYLSSTQFAEAITNMNTSGTPCTITTVAGERMADCPMPEDARTQFREEFAARMRKTMDRVTKVADGLDAVLAKKAINNADRDFIRSALAAVRMELGSNAPFVHEQFDEAMDKTVHEAKGEVEAFIQTKIHRAGLDALAAKVVSEAPALAIDDKPTE